MDSSTIGVLALQGSFSEHVSMLKKLGVSVVEVRLPEQLEGLSGLVLPGGESTAMAIVGADTGIFPALRTFVRSGKPVWGTCAGMILLSDSAVFQKEGGQALVGGLDVEVCRNFFGSQVQSCELELETSGDVGESTATTGGGGVAPPKTNAVFIRAPAIIRAGKAVEVLARVKATPSAMALRTLKEEAQGGTSKQQDESKEGDDADGSSPRQAKRAKSSRKESEEEEEARLQAAVMAAGSKRHVPRDADMSALGVATNEKPWDVIVAARQGNIIATAFHPEFTNDLRWHEYFLGVVSEFEATAK